MMVLDILRGGDALLNEAKNRVEDAFRPAEDMMRSTEARVISAQPAPCFAPDARSLPAVMR